MWRWLLAGAALWVIYKPEETVKAAVAGGSVVKSGVSAVVKAVTREPLGIRLNNPGNIEINPSNGWVGEVRPSSHARYAQFSHPVYGLRALAETLETYRLKYGITTVRGVIERWAPEHENDTESYIRSVVGRTGLAESADIRLNPVAFVAALVHHENGKQPYDLAVIQEAIRMAWDGL